MKKVITLGGLALMMAGCGFINEKGMTLFSSKTLLDVDQSADTSTEESVTYLPVDTDGNFTLASTSKEVEISSFIRSRNDTFWDAQRSFSALDKFFDSINMNGEDWTGVFQSKSFTTTKEYIYFTLGGSSLNKVRLVDEDETNEDDKVIHEISNTYFSDPYASCNMLIYSMKIDGDRIGHNMHIEVVDSTTSGFGGITFGDLHVNQNEEEVAKAYSVYLNNLNYTKYQQDESAANVNKNARDYVYSLYSNSANADLYKFYNYKLTDGDVTFDEGNDNLSTLAFDSDYASNLGDFQFGGFISDVEAYDWNEQMPFNNEGYFFNGNGYSTRNENAKFRFLTNKFTLSGTGIVSVKMAGRSAQLQVLDPSKIGTDVDPVLETLDTPDFVDNGVGNIYLSGSNYNTLHKVYWDLTKYIDQDIVLAIADKDTDGNWGMVFFDSLVTKYDEVPAFRVDTFAQKHKDSDVTYYGAYTDLYVKASNVEGEYNSALDEAYTFLTSYYALSAKVDKKHNYFDSLYTEEAKNNVDAYALLSSNAKAIVDSSEDFYFDGEDDAWQTVEPTVCDVKDRIKALVKVTYVYNNGEENKEEYVEYKNGFTPETPTKESDWDTVVEFGGWYTDEEFGNPYQEGQSLTSDLTLYAKWNESELREIANIKNSMTKASLSYHYTATTMKDGTKEYTISDVGISFGGMIDKSDYETVREHVVSYGVSLTTTLPNGYTNLTDAIKDNASFGEGQLITNEKDASQGQPELATSDEKTNELQSADYYLFNAYLGVEEADYANAVYAVAYLKLDNDKTIFLYERSASVRSLAREYLNNKYVTKSEGVIATLTILSESI